MCKDQQMYCPFTKWGRTFLSSLNRNFKLKQILMMMKQNVSLNPNNWKSHIFTVSEEDIGTCCLRVWRICHCLLCVKENLARICRQNSSSLCFKQTISTLKYFLGMWFLVNFTVFIFHFKSLHIPSNKLNWYNAKQLCPDLIKWSFNQITLHNCFAYQWSFLPFQSNNQLI